MLHNLLFKAIFDQDYPNLGRLCNMLVGTGKPGLHSSCIGILGMRRDRDILL